MEFWYRIVSGQTCFQLQDANVNTSTNTHNNICAFNLPERRIFVFCRFGFMPRLLSKRHVVPPLPSPPRRRFCLGPDDRCPCLFAGRLRMGHKGRVFALGIEAAFPRLFTQGMHACTYKRKR